MVVESVSMIAGAVSVSVRLGEDPTFDSGRMAFSVLKFEIGIENSEVMDWAVS
jgi:hypothetical protein